MVDKGWLTIRGAGRHAVESFLRLGHATRFLGLTLALRYEAEPEAPFLQPSRPLLSPEAVRRAIILGVALRLAYTLSAGTAQLLTGTRLVVGARLTLELAEGTGVFAGESVTRRLDRLAQTLGLDATTTLAA